MSVPVSLVLHPPSSGTSLVASRCWPIRLNTALCPREHRKLTSPRSVSWFSRLVVTRVTILPESNRASVSVNHHRDHGGSMTHLASGACRGHRLLSNLLWSPSTWDCRWRVGPTLAVSTLVCGPLALPTVASGYPAVGLSFRLLEWVADSVRHPLSRASGTLSGYRLLSSGSCCVLWGSKLNSLLLPLVPSPTILYIH